MTMFTYRPEPTGRPRSAILCGVSNLLIAIFFAFSAPLHAQNELDARWDSRFGWNGVVGEVLDIAAGECDMYVVGRFSADDSDNYVARFEGSGYSRLGNEPIDGTIRTVVVDGSEVYIGGDFSSIGDLQAGGIARWNGIGWETIGAGVEGGGATVHDIALFGNDIFIAGDFTSVNGVTANNIARWSGINQSWSAVGPGTDGVVHDLFVQGDWLYLGGRFLNAGGISTSNIVRYNLINQTWQRLGSGLNDTVRAIAVTDRYVYAAGDFTNSGLVEIGHVGVYDRATGDWTSMAGGADASGYDLLLDGDDLYVAGEFSEIGGVSTEGVARWNGSAWESLGDGLDGPARAIAACAERICVGGAFQNAGSVDAPWVAAWEGNGWSRLITGESNGLNRPANAVAFLPESEVPAFYAGGEFTMAGSNIVGHIAFWDGNEWQSLGDGLDGTVRALDTDGSIVVAGGTFSASGGTALQNVGKWDRATRAWESLGDGVNGTVHAVVIDGNVVWVAGEFSTAGGEAASNIARYDLMSESWQTLGTGVDGTVYDLALGGGTLHVVGDFSTAGGAETGNYAAWDLTERTWTTLSPGMNAPVRAVAITENGEIYVGGDFTRTSTPEYDRLTQHVAINDGFEWRGLEGGLREGVRITTVFDITTSGESIFLGGEFTLAGGVPIGYLARWRESWVPLGSGIDGVLPVVYGLDASDDFVAVAGSFSRAGDTSSVNIALWDDRTSSVSVSHEDGLRGNIQVSTRMHPDRLDLRIEVDGSESVEGRIVLTNLRGMITGDPVTFRNATDGMTYRIDISDLPSGIYLLRLETDHGVSGRPVMITR